MLSGSQFTFQPSPICLFLVATRLHQSDHGRLLVLMRLILLGE